MTVHYVCTEGVLHLCACFHVELTYECTKDKGFPSFHHRYGNVSKQLLSIPSSLISILNHHIGVSSGSGTRCAPYQRPLCPAACSLPPWTSMENILAFQDGLSSVILHPRSVSDCLLLAMCLPHQFALLRVIYHHGRPGQTSLHNKTIISELFCNHICLRVSPGGIRLVCLLRASRNKRVQSGVNLSTGLPRLFS
jgi:hypothetical protein